MIYIWVVVLSHLEETPSQVSASEDCTIPEETEEQHQENDTEIRIAVKEEDEPFNSKNTSY